MNRMSKKQAFGINEDDDNSSTSLPTKETSSYY